MIHNRIYLRWWVTRVYLAKFPEDKHLYGFRFAGWFGRLDGGKAAKG